MENTASLSNDVDKWPPPRVNEVLDYAFREQWGRKGSTPDAGLPVNALGKRNDPLLPCLRTRECERAGVGVALVS
jgi:hypothetical protein